MAGHEILQGNRFLAALPRRERDELLQRCERIDAAAHTPLRQAGSVMEHCYFADRGAVSLVIRLADGFEIAPGMVGPEGIIGLGRWRRTGFRQ